MFNVQYFCLIFVSVTLFHIFTFLFHQTYIAIHPYTSTYFLLIHFLNFFSHFVLFIIYLCRRALLAVSVSFEKTLLTVFKDKDEENNGLLSLNSFTRILVNLGSMLNSEEISLIAERYKANENNGNGRKSVSEMKGLYNGNQVESNRNFLSSGKVHTHTHTYTRLYTHINTYAHTHVHEHVQKCSSTYTLHICIKMNLLYQM